MEQEPEDLEADFCANCKFVKNSLGNQPYEWQCTANKPTLFDDQERRIVIGSGLGCGMVTMVCVASLVSTSPIWLGVSAGVGAIVGSLAVWAIMNVARQ